MTNELSAFKLRPNASIREAMSCIDRNAKGIALVVDREGRLLATVTDGDIRRALLDRIDPDSDLAVLVARSEREPLTAPAATDTATLIELMTENSLRHIPVVDEDGRVAGLAVLNDLVKEIELPLRAVVMAGGFGTRLHPLTAETPKPMLPVGGRPLLEHVIDQLRACGIRRVNLTTHYLADAITEHFGDGSRFGMEIDYVNETQPLGTAGALALLEESNEPMLVLNGDILTRVDYRAMLEFHREHSAAMTVGVRQQDVQLPFGVVDSDGVHIRSIVEKPVVAHFINAGIYVLDPSVRPYVPGSGRFDMPELVEKLIAASETVVAFPVREYWMDIGQPSSYEQAERDIGAGKLER